MKKILHWTVFLSFLALCATSLAAEYFFSKEAIMKSLQISLPMINHSIEPVDQLHIAKIMRRDTWDFHFFSGVIFGIALLFWIIISYKTIFRTKIWQILLILSGFVLTISGIIMYLRLYYPLKGETFSLLKEIHNYSVDIFLLSLFLHILCIVIKENYTKLNLVSNMLRKNK